MELWKHWWVKSGLVLVVGILIFVGLSSFSAEQNVAVTGPDGPVALLISQNANGMVTGTTLYYDDLPVGGDGSAQAYVLGAKWNKNPVTYSFLNCPIAVDCAAAYQAVRTGVEAWDAVSGITLNEVGAGGDIQIGWFLGNHGDGNLFDGPGDILAHAFFPVSYLGGLAGDMHFDDAENWALGPSSADHQVHLTTVAMHEIGHSLGLDHTGDPSALMWAEYTGVRTLGADDIAGVQALYGPPNADDGVAAPPPAPPAPSTPSSVTATTTTAIRFRTGPGTAYRSLTTLPANVTVPVLGRNVDASWVYVEYNGTRGWLAAWLCSFNAGPETVPVVNPDGTGAAPAPPVDPVPPVDPGQPVPPLPPGTVSVESTVNVRIRQGPSTGYTQIDTLPANTAVPVLGRVADNSWLYIQYGQTQGWVAGWLMTITGNLNTVPVVDVQGKPIPYTEAGESYTASHAGGFEALTILLHALVGEIAQ